MFAVSTVFPAVYYVDPTGDDTNVGTSQSPWLHCPGMSGWNGSDTLASGDSVYFKNTGTWIGTDSTYMLIAHSGVCYNGAAWGHGTRARFYNNRAMVQEKGMVRIDSDDVSVPTVIRGFYINGYVGNCDGVRFQGNGYYQCRMQGAMKVVDNCYIDSCGSNAANWTYGIEITSIPYGPTGDHGILKNVQITNNIVAYSSRNGIACYPNGLNDSNTVVNCLIRGNNIYGSGTTSAGTSGAGISSKNWVDSIIIEFNYSHDNAGTLQMSGIGMLFDNSSLSNPLGTFHGTCRYNIFANNRSSGIQIFKSGGRDVSIYGNLFVNNYQGGVLINLNSFTHNKLRIFNNTFFSNFHDKTNWRGGVIEFSPGAYTYDMLEICNNVFYADSGGSGVRCCYYNERPEIVPTLLRNNLYYRNGGGYVVRQAGSYYDSSSLHAWEALGTYGLPPFWDTTEIPTGFAGTFGVSMVPNANGLSFASGVAIDGGFALPDAFNGAINLSGISGTNARPQGSAWDIGAYELSGAVPIRNPYHHPTSIGSGSLNSGCIFVKIYDLSGRVITSFVNENPGQGSPWLHWDLRDIPSGYYVVKMQSGSQTNHANIAILKKGQYRKN